MGATSVRLNCEQCQRRKTKCDKGSPCSACKNAGFSCNIVQRARLPRGRSGKARNKSTELEARVGHIEDLIKRLEAQASSSSQNTVIHNQKSEPDSDPVSLQAQKSNSFVAQEFWTALSQEVASLRDVLEVSEDDDEPQPTTNKPDVELIDPSHTPSAILFGRQPVSTTSSTIPCPSTQTQSLLLNLYRSRVDCVFKVLHWPSVLESIERGRTTSGYKLRSDAIHALEYSIYLAALCSITDDECETLLSSDRPKLLQQYKVATETLISKADLFQSSDITILQAFVIYLLGLRSCMSGATAWTLLAIAVRVASAHRLGSDDVSGLSVHDLETRRRLWFSIGVLDAQSSLDRGTLPLLRADEYGIPPLDIDDADLGSHVASGACTRSFTDMSFAWITHRAMICQKKLCDMSIRSSYCWDNWDEKLQVVTDFEQMVRRNHEWIEDTAQPFAQYTKHASTGIAVTMHLLLRRPPYQSKNSAVPPWDDFNVMGVTTEILERSMEKQTSNVFVTWSWFSWVKWYALAVLLAELCGNHQGELADRAYLVAKQSFVRYARLIADTDSGLLWKPIVRLMRRVQRIRERDVHNVLPSSKTSTVLPVNIQGDQMVQPDLLNDSHSGRPQSKDSGDLDPFAHLSPMGIDWTRMTFMDDELPNMNYNDQGATVMEGIDAENGSSWQDWDLFLADMNSSDNRVF